MKRKLNLLDYFFVAVPLIYGCYLVLPDLLITERSLVQINGTITKVNLEYYQSKGSRESSGTISELIIRFRNDTKRYAIKKNIGWDRYNYKFEKLKIHLELDEFASIWIKKTDLNNPSPKIFKIENSRDDTLYTKKDATENHGFILILCLFVSGMFFYNAKKRKN